MLGNLQGWHLIVVLAVLVLAIVVPALFVVPRARRRREAIAAGTIVVGTQWSVLAIVGFILSLFSTIVAIIVCSFALDRVTRHGQRGWGVAVAGLWIAYVELGIGVVVILVALVARSSVA